MDKLYKTFDKKSAEALNDAGFVCMTEVINGETLYVFVATEELQDFISTKFAGNGEFFTYNKMTF